VFKVGPEWPWHICALCAGVVILPVQSACLHFADVRAGQLFALVRYCTTQKPQQARRRSLFGDTKLLGLVGGIGVNCVDVFVGYLYLPISAGVRGSASLRVVPQCPFGPITVPEGLPDDRFVYPCSRHSCPAHSACMRSPVRGHRRMLVPWPCTGSGRRAVRGPRGGRGIIGAAACSVWSLVPEAVLGDGPPARHRGRRRRPGAGQLAMCPPSSSSIPRSPMTDSRDHSGGCEAHVNRLCEVSGQQVARAAVPAPLGE